MTYVTTDTMPLATVLAYLPAETLCEEEFKGQSTIYTYGCGCKVVHWLISYDCYVRWCVHHEPRGSKRSSRSLSSADV